MQAYFVFRKKMQLSLSLPWAFHVTDNNNNNNNKPTLLLPAISLKYTDLNPWFERFKRVDEVLMCYSPDQSF